MFKGKQVFHKNLTDEEIDNGIITLLETKFTNLTINTSDYQYSYRITSKGKVLSNKKKNTNESFVILSHNKKKRFYKKIDV